jgi:hypothetical protein
VAFVLDTRTERVGTDGLRLTLRNGERALYVEGDLAASRGYFDVAYRMAEPADDTVAMARAAVGLGGLWVHEHRGAAATTLIESRQRATLARLPAGSPLALRLRVRLAAEADYLAGSSDSVLAVLGETERSADPFARADALNLAHHCVLGPQHSARRHWLALELIGQAQHSRRRGDLVLGLLWRAVDRLLDGDPNSLRSVSELTHMLAQRPHRAAGYVLRAIDVMRTIRAGRFDDAETLATECFHEGSAVGDADATGWFGGHLVAVRWFQGRIAELVGELGRIANSPTLGDTDTSFVAALAVANAVAGDNRAAAGALARISDGDLTRVPSYSSWLVSMYAAVEAADLLADRATAHRAYTLLEPYGDRPMMASLGVACFGSVRHALGVASLTVGATDRAVEHLRAAVRQNLALEHWPAAVLSRWRLAAALELQAQAGGAAWSADGRAAADREAAAEREAARREAAEFGMKLPDARSTPIRTAPPPLSRNGSRAHSRRRGTQWEFGVDARSVLVPDWQGIRYLAGLIANPGQEIAATDLAAGLTGTGNTTDPDQPLLDDAARAGYRKRLADLDAAIDAAIDEADDTDRADALRAEREWVLAELATAAGFGGRVRAFNSNHERARIAVGKAIRRGVARITAQDPVLGQHLRDSVHTGRFCRYDP